MKQPVQHNQCLLDVADKAATLYEKSADLTSFPGNSTGRPSDADTRACIRQFAEVADSAHQATRWLRRASSHTAGWNEDEVAKSFEQVYRYTTNEAQQEFSADAEGHARRAVARRQDQRTLSRINRSPPEAFANLAHRSRRRRLNYTYPAPAAAAAAASSAVSPPQPTSPPTDPRLGVLAQAVVDLTDEDVEALPIASVDSTGNVDSVDGDDALDRFLTTDPDNAPAGGLTIADAPSALTAPNCSASSSDSYV